MADSSTDRRRILTGWILLAVSILMIAFLWSDLANGVRSLGWSRVPATIVEAWHHREYDPEASLGMDDAVHRSWDGLSVAYKAPDGRHLLTGALDTAGLPPNRVWFPRPSTARLRHVIGQRESLRVSLDPLDSRRAVIRPGIPWTTGVALFVPVSLLALGVSALRRRRDPEKPYHPGAAVVAWALLLGLFALFAFGASHLFVSIAGSMPPWWLMPAASLATLLLAVFPGLLQAKRLATAVSGLLVAMPLLGIVGLCLMKVDSFGRDWTDAEFVDRLGHEHPAVAESAAEHFARNAAPKEAVDPLRKLVLDHPSRLTRRQAARALHRMKKDAIPALPDLRRAFEDPANSEIRPDLDAAIRGLEHVRRLPD